MMNTLHHNKKRHLMPHGHVDASSYNCDDDRTDRTVFVEGIDHRWTVEYLRYYIHHILKKNFHIQEGGCDDGPVVIAGGIDRRFLHAFVELCSVEVAQKLVSLSGIMSSHGNFLLMKPWKENVEAHRDGLVHVSKCQRLENNNLRTHLPVVFDNWGDYYNNRPNAHLGKENHNSVQVVHPQELPNEATYAPDPISLKIYVHQDPPRFDSKQLLEYLVFQMRKHELLTNEVEGKAIVTCKDLSKGAWLVETASEDISNKLLYLNRIQSHSTVLWLSRHPDYNGPPPDFNDYYHFLQKLESDRKQSATMQPPSALNQHQYHHQNRTPSEHSQWTNGDDVSTELPARKIGKEDVNILEEHDSDTSLPSSTKFAMEQSTFASIQGHETAILHQATQCIMLNIHLKKKLANMVKGLERMEKQNTVLNQENKVLSAKMEQMEQSFGSERSRISVENEALSAQIVKLEDALQQDCESRQLQMLTDENKKLWAKLKELERLQQEDAGSKDENASSNIVSVEDDPTPQETLLLQDEKVNQLTIQLTTTQQQLDVVHTSWQEQHLQLLEKDKEIKEWQEKYQNAERRFQEVTKALSIEETCDAIYQEIEPG